MKQITKDFIENQNININDIESVDRGLDIIIYAIKDTKRGIYRVIDKKNITDLDKECIDMLIDKLNDYNTIKSELNDIYINL